MSEIQKADRPAAVTVAAVVEDQDVRTVTQALAAPFDANEVRWKPQVVQGNRALAIAYTDARTVQDRLDEVLGVEGWQDKYEVLPDGSVVCRLELRIGGEWVTKMDVGSPSEQPDGGDRMKAAFSDALKRAAVKFGIGRYLYRLPSQWCEYDPQKRQFVRTPTLPAFALPRHARAAAAQPAAVRTALPAKVDANQTLQDGMAEQMGDACEAPAGPPPAKANGHAKLPKTGKELFARLKDYESGLVAAKLCRPNELIDCVSQAGIDQGLPPRITDWAGEAAMKLAAKETSAFEARRRKAG